MTRNCRSSRYAHTGAATTATSMAIIGAFFVGPSFHALCVRCVLLVVGVYTVLGFICHY